MKTINIDHPLRRICYDIRSNPIFSKLEAQCLQDYRLAHDQTWRMKQLFDSQKGEIQLTLVDLNELDAKREELHETLGFYTRQVDFNRKDLHKELEIKFQVELRDFYRSVRLHHQQVIQFYDRIAVLDAEYTLITDTYLKGNKPIDPLDFKVLDPIFRHHEDMDVMIASLDNDLQKFLKVIHEVYELLDRYIEVFNTLYNRYSTIIHATAQLTKDAEVLNILWEE